MIVNRGARIEAVGTAANPITFTSLADVNALATTATTDDLAATATAQWRGISILGQALHSLCNYNAPGGGGARRPFEASDPFTLAAQPTLTVADCSRGIPLDGFYGGTNPADNSGRLDYVIIKHVGTNSGSFGRDALQFRAVGSATRISNIEIYSVDGVAIRLDGGGVNLSNVLIYNPQRNAILADNGYLGVLDTVLVSQADGVGEACIRVATSANGEGTAGIADGLNTRVTLRNLTCDVSANNENGAGVVVTEAGRVRLQNAIIVGTRVAADNTEDNDNACLDLQGGESIIEADGVIAACLEASTVVTAANFATTAGTGARVIATDATTPTTTEVGMDVQFHLFTGAPTTISPLAGTDTGLALLSTAGTQETRPLFSLLLNASRVSNVPPSVVASSAGTPSRTYLGAITTGTNPFSIWTFGVFTAP